MTDILENLFGSRVKLRIMRFFLLNPEEDFNAIEISERNKLDKTATKKELNGLNKIKFISSKTKKRKKYYKIDKTFPFYFELEKLILRSNIFPECKSMKKISGIGNVRLVLTSGVFLNYSKSRVDLLIVVDNVSKIKLKSLMRSLESEVGKEIRYMVLTSEELMYRLDMLDRFLLEFFKSPHDIVINKIPKFDSIISNIKR
ncbi:MAG: hypothetical protein OEV93_04485 [Candidatus Moranbacteria bacterium]|nr:hypothetical protein [Candidatus Moranbacteria bacterium]